LPRTWNSPGQQIAVQHQQRKLRQLTYASGHGAGQQVIVQIQLGQLCELLGSDSGIVPDS
jgi:hypothetical protein